RSGCGGAGGSWRSVGAALWSEEEVAVRREGPSWVRFFVTGVRLPCMIRACAAGCSCCCATCVASVVARGVRAVAARLALDSLAVVFLVWRTLAGKSRCSVCHVASPVERCDTYLWLFVGLVLAGCELWLRRIAWLPCVLERFPITNDALVVLVEVLPGPACVASAVLPVAVFSLMRALLDGGLVSAVGVWLAVLLVEPESLWLLLPVRQSRCSVFCVLLGADMAVALLK
ncbi:hypothetical protein Taro_003554, partial [Colocasia esculenta]|nr:hypothetical protein [Colocasia esculenta]